jgi:hypothetical protein
MMAIQKHRPNLPFVGTETITAGGRRRGKERGGEMDGYGMF